jgi:hypothetical protein
MAHRAFKRAFSIDEVVEPHPPGRYGVWRVIRPWRDFQIFWRRRLSRTSVFPRGESVVYMCGSWIWHNQHTMKEKEKREIGRPEVNLL